MLSVDTTSLRHPPRRSGKNCDLQFDNSDRFMYDTLTLTFPARYCRHSDNKVATLFLQTYGKSSATNRYDAFTMAWRVLVFNWSVNPANNVVSKCKRILNALNRPFEDNRLSLCQ